MASLPDSDLFSVPVRTSSYCSSGGCVGVRPVSAGVEIVDTKSDASGLVLSHDEWVTFVSRVKDGALDRK